MKKLVYWIALVLTGCNASGFGPPWNKQPQAHAQPDASGYLAYPYISNAQLAARARAAQQQQGVPNPAAPNPVAPDPVAPTPSAPTPSAPI